MATVRTPSRSGLRLALAQWSVRSGVVLALWFAQANFAVAVTIDSPTAPEETNSNENDASSLLKSPHKDTITLQTRAPDSGDDDILGLTSGALAIDKNVTLAEPPMNLLLARRDRGPSIDSIVRLDAKHTVVIEDLADSSGLGLPAQLVILAAGGIAMFFFSLAVSYRQLQRPRGRRVRFGILWHAFKPICGKCGRQLSVLNDYSFHCPSCRVELGARAENGKTLSPREALSKIRLKEYW